MDLEAMQILNLSPIPELSEIELSTMLEHLSGLSDINGDLTDRNVEDILKEAEDLLDKSTSSKALDSRSENKSPEIEEKNSTEINEEINTSIDKELNSQPLDVDEIKQTTSVSSNSQINTHNEHDADKHYNSPVENSPVTYSPGSSSNPIKSTIDSLKEFSTLIEKKLAKQSLTTSPKNCETSKNIEVAVPDTPKSQKLINTKETLKELKTVKSPNLVLSQNATEPFDKSIKLLNCFERLYRDKPLRLSSKKPEVVVKSTKTVAKKKFSKNVKTSKKSNWQGKTSRTKTAEGEMNIITYKRPSQPYQLSSYDSEDMCESKTLITKHSSSDNKLLGNGDDALIIPDDLKRNSVKLVQSHMDEKLIPRVLDRAEEIKDSVKSGETPEERSRGKIGVDVVKTGASLSEIDDRASGIKQLEEQFCILKEKYNNQIDKLEAENCKLREALTRQQEAFTSQEFLRADNPGAFYNPYSCLPEKKLSRTFSLENCKAPKNSPCSSTEDVQTSTTVKEAFSQTESNLKNTSIQCSRESLGGGNTDEKKTENKENFISKKKPAKTKPFSDVNVRQKKALEHETQLLATLRGLQAEASAKDKENRKLKSEIESLKKQIKKQGNVKVDNYKRCNTGTQTIGLGVFFQKPYNPENFQVPFDFEKENEDLKSRIKALEEDFEFLKEKRVADLQSLHQVHEEEMARLVSKLETQSALTKHLHSLLVNR